ncbi:MAG: glycoside hydrolase, partial [bacterium]
VYALIDATQGGLYRSDDGGATWARVSDDGRIWQRGWYFGGVTVDPKDADVVYVCNTNLYRSVDGGSSFTAFKGAPGGDDYHRIWINPLHPEVMLLASDQGAVVTVNGGSSWGTWYNQPTAQFYHVSTDNAFPYRVCGGQQESGSACVTSRGDDGQITFHDWHPVAVEEYGYVAADPLDPDIVYGGRLTRFDRRTGQAQEVAPHALRGTSPDYRVLRTAPVLFSPLDPHTLFFATNQLWKTTDEGQHWTALSPDLSRASWDAPPNVGVYRGTDAAKLTRRGVIYTVAPSPLEKDRIWVGTDDGLVHLTTDQGAHWTDVTPAVLRDRPWSKISLLEASHFDAATAYAAVNTLRLDDLRPHVYRTRDSGKSWTEISAGMPDGGIVNAVREDPVRRSLLFAGTEQAVYVSFDDGDHWQSLRLNMPATSIRDLVVKDDDLVVGTHGRSFWILDDITPLRHVQPAKLAQNALLFPPQKAWRFRWNKWPDTPLPPDEPAGENPPDGAILHYRLGAAAQGPVTLEIVDGA